MDLIQFRKKFGKANITSLVERVSRFAVFLRNNDGTFCFSIATRTNLFVFKRLECSLPPADLVL